MMTLHDIEKTLAARRPAILAPGLRRHAAVALILRPAPNGLQILFIERARHDGDPWSGDLGFPGGKIEEGEEGVPQRAAERETLEEVGIDLTKERYLGRLDDIEGAHLPVVVSCFVYRIGQNPSLTCNAEIQDAWWVSLVDLVDPERHVEAPVYFCDRQLLRPAIRLCGSDRAVLWGITYRLVCQFLRLLGHEMDRQI